jgi:hypothetical protein
MDSVRKKIPEIWRTNSWFLLHDNVPVHRSVLVHDFLAENNVTTLEHSYIPDLAPTYFYLFHRLKAALKGRCFYDANDIIKNATAELKRFPQNGFPEYF